MIGVAILAALGSVVCFARFIYLATQRPEREDCTLLG